jgi:hypothetical protein
VYIGYVGEYIQVFLCESTTAKAMEDIYQRLGTKIDFPWVTDIQIYKDK